MTTYHSPIGSHFPIMTRLGVVFLLLVSVLAIGLFYFQCSQRRLEAMQNAAKTSYKGNQVHRKAKNEWQKWQKINGNHLP
jgi:cell division protein FtsL